MKKHLRAPFCNGYYSLPYEAENLIDLLLASTTRYSKNIAIEFFDSDGSRQSSTYSQLENDVSRALNALQHYRLDDKTILLTGEKTYEWIVMFFAIIAAQGVVIPASKDSFENLMRSDGIDDLKIDAIFCDASAYKDWANIGQTLSPSVQVIKLRDSFSSFWAHYSLSRIEEPQDVDSCVVMLFTSGTTGNTKCVQLSHANLMSDVKASQMLLGRTEHDRMLSFLPVYHAYELTTALLTPLYVGATIGISRGIKFVHSDIQLFSPTIMLIVPVIAQSFIKGINRAIQNNKHVKTINILRALSKRPFPVVSTIARKLLYKIIVKQFGGKLETLVCGGSALRAKTENEFFALGFSVLCGYGATECSPVIACNTEGQTRVGSVGRTTPLCKVKIVEGELWVQGAIVSRGYLDQKQTDESFCDGWFKTGDLATIDEDGYIFLHGRKSEILVLDNGENVSPELMENLLLSIPEIKDVVVCLTSTGNSRLLTAIISSDDGGDPARAKENLSNKIDLLDLPSHLYVQRIVLVHSDFPLTGTGKTDRQKTVQTFLSDEKST